MRYAIVLILAVLAAVFVPGCATVPTDYHYKATFPVPRPALYAPVVVENPPQTQVVWIETNKGYVQAYKEENKTYVVNGAGEMISIPSGTGLGVVYVEPQDIRAMGQENRANFYALLRADQQGHRQSIEWARLRLQRDQQEHRQEIEERREDRRDQQQLMQIVGEVNDIRNQNIFLGTNIIPTPAQVQDRRMQQQEVKIPATVIRTSEERSVRMTTPSVSRPLATERRVVRAEVIEQQRKPVVVPPGKRTARPEVPVVSEQRERRINPPASFSSRTQKVVTRSEAGSQPRTRGER